MFLSPVHGDETFDHLWAEVEAQSLWDDPEWMTLGHYHRTFLGRISSRMDDDAFFLSPQGKHNRKLELQATLAAFVDPSLVAGERSVACRFPARYKWLLAKLALPEDVFPGGDCEDFLLTVADLKVNSATLIYPSAYLNSPASMFGHLLLVLDREGKNRLLSRAVNYAAIVDDRFGPLFAVKGIFGFYDGVYTLLPYYEKVEEYASVNRRDIWEYSLELTPDELDMLLRHVWELQTLQSRYFFFKENCAFNLLYPIQVARPSLDLVNHFRMSAIPVSLLQDLTRSGITAPPVYRPSKATDMSFLASQLSKQEIETAKQLVDGASLTGNESPQLLSLVIAWVQYLYTEKEITNEEYKTRILPLFSAQSKMGKQNLPEAPAPEPPENGHAPRRISAYGGVDTVSGDAIAGVKIRAAYHDWLDNPVGYPLGSSIRMFEFDVQGRPEDGEIYLNQLTLMDVRSLTPPEPWVKPLSWEVAFGGEADPFNPQHLRWYGNFSSGITRGIGSQGLAYVMLTQHVIWDTNLKSNLSWEPGFEWGITSVNERFALGLRGWHTWGVLGYHGSRQEVEAEGRCFLNINTSLGLSSVYYTESGEDENIVSFNFYRSF
ncbi:DUF4105 domain-containing protein [Kiritimatiellota bacterium B12222]|nr:DUF4105 domain-containing protein [Kiritimatiellota bacterium B12222]